MPTITAPSGEPSGKSMAPHPALFGRIRDVDTHEMFPALLWSKEYGKFAEPLAEFFLKNQAPQIPNSFAVRQNVDDMPIDAANLSSYWGTGCLAPGAYDMERRLKVMDVAGIDDTLIFGSMMAVVGMIFASAGAEFFAKQLFGRGEIAFDANVLGREMITEHNNWCIKVASMSPRLRPVATILSSNLREALVESERVIAGGVRAVMLAAGDPIEGKAPSHPDNDVLWKLFAKNNVAVLLHIGGDKAFLRGPLAWTNAPHFQSNTTVPTEQPVDPFSLATCSLAPQNYLTNMVLGAVFERVPDLRCGCMELGGHWIGPTGQNMDIWVDQFAKRFKGQLSMKPSEYIQRNVRVSPFSFEPVDRYIEHFPYLQDVFCFSTDYPHYEGGKSPITDMVNRVTPLGTDVVEKFFVTNANWVMP